MELAVNRPIVDPADAVAVLKLKLPLFAPIVANAVATLDPNGTGIRG